jgi:NAD(P)-dependent dehydrogenase (short-subunit alcohol dehydrogenase family)
MANAQKKTGAADPKEREPKPPFDEAEQSSPGSEQKMRVKPDHGEQSYKGLGRLERKIALVTGADSGIGRAVAIAFAREGADVAIAYLSEDEDARETQRWVEAAGRRALLVRGDLAEEKECASVVERTVKHFGRIDVLVNNAAFQTKEAESVDDLDASRVERTFRVNVIAMFHLVRHALAHMQAGGTIINTSSVQAYQPSFAILDYAATKGAIVTFTKGLALEVVRRGIRANCVAPGPVWTPLIAQSFSGEKLDKFGEQSPMERPAQPKELAPAYVFLACDESSYVNGEVLGVTGGRPLG